MKNLFDKAIANLALAKMVLVYGSHDEEELNLAGFHLQQAMEIAMKCLLELNGVIYPRTHSLTQLENLALSQNIDLYLTPELEVRLFEIESWESQSRYIVGYLIAQQKLETAAALIEEYFQTIKAKEAN